MNKTLIPLLLVAVALGTGLAWADDMKGMEMKGESKQDMPMGDKKSGKTHRAVGTVKSVDMAKGTVTIDHGPVKSLNWPAMAMTFGVKDMPLLDKMAEGKKVTVDFVQEGSDYTITKVK